ncbi:Ig-like domain-containing protein [Curtobacterium sp. MCBD17_021]|uniref:Ig-like domain-containing protein n=1 Tax=Curtobacterium sp. MCBD17_021 TaxID=2175665 RepID=UPI0011B382F0|nr:Ig-like domain-containing protein [Curtobacterium sp. MCBD17_021]
MAQLTGLPIGSTKVSIEAFDGGESVAELEVEVALEVRRVSASASFDSDVATVAQLAGKAQPNTTVNFWFGQQKLPFTAESDENGDWQTPLNPPNRAGVWDITVSQTIRSDRHNGELELPVDYGDGVTVTSDSEPEVAAGESLLVTGTAPSGTQIKAYETSSPQNVLGSVRAGTDDRFRLWIDDLEDREYKLLVSGMTKGANITSAAVTVNPGKSSVANPTASVEFPDDITKKAVVSGTGVADATIEVEDEDGKRLGDTTVDDEGNWSLAIDPIGPGKHELTVEQTGIEGAQTTTTEIDYGAAVSLDAPTTFTGGKTTVTGKSSKGAQVTITTGGKQVDSFTVTNADGSFSRDLTGLGAGKIELQATAKSKGALTTTTTASSTAPITAESIQISSHVKNGTFMPGEQLFTGRGTVGATVTLNVHGFSPATAAQDLTTTVDQFGEWSIKRGLANTTYPLFSVKQTPQAGVTNELLNWNLRPYDGIGAPGDLQLTNFKDGDFFNPGDQTFAGKATPGATIVFNPFGLDNPAVEQYDITTKADSKTGDWTIRRGLANTNYDRIGIRQEPAAEGKVNQIDDIRVAPYGWVGAPADLTVTSHAGGAFTPGNQTFTGTATPGTTVTLYAWGDNPINPATGIADARGKWTIHRILNTPPTNYNIKIVQENAGAKVDTVYLPLTAEQ